MKKIVVTYRFPEVDTFSKKASPDCIVAYVIQNIDRATLLSAEACFYDHSNHASDEKALLTVAIIVTLDEAMLLPSHDPAALTQSVLSGLQSLCCAVNEHSKNQYEIYLWDFSSWNA